MKVFILEDDKERIALFWEVLEGHDVTVAMGIAEAQEKFAPPYDLYLLDHDLGGGQFLNSGEYETGQTFLALEQVKAALPGQFVLVHSFNPEGAKRMVELAKEAGAAAVLYIPFGNALFQVALRILELLPGGELQVEASDEVHQG